MFSILKKKFITNKLLYNQVKRIHADFDPSKDYYKILRIDSKASEKQIKEEYYRLAKKHHPDLNKGVSSDFFKEITSAYEILSDQEKRKKYDQLRGYSIGGSWNTSGNSNSKQNNNEYQQYSKSHQRNFYNTNNKNNKSYKTWEFTYKDPNTGERKTINFNDDAFKNFEDFISKMRSEIKTDFSKSYSNQDKSKTDFFDNNYEKNNFYYDNQKPNDKFKTREDFNFKFQLDLNMNYLLLSGSVFILFTILSFNRPKPYNKITFNETFSQDPSSTYAIKQQFATHKT